jgi:hypothetical protein
VRGATVVSCPTMRDDSSITPDTKNWTWVLTRRCPECGLDAGRVTPAEIGTMTRTSTAAWERVLARPDVGDRPSPSVWSPLEYACHVRDVHRIFDQRVALMLAQEDPAFENWDQDETALQERYGEQDPAAVATELSAAARTLADRFDAVADDQWGRTARRSDGARFTVASLGQYAVHDWVHHLHDVREGGAEP